MPTLQCLHCRSALNKQYNVEYSIKETKDRLNIAEISFLEQQILWRIVHQAALFFG